jgi:hypothetical protein
MWIRSVGKIGQFGATVSDASLSTIRCAVGFIGRLGTSPGMGFFDSTSSTGQFSLPGRQRIDSSWKFPTVPNPLLSGRRSTRQYAGWPFSGQSGTGDNHRYQQTLRIIRFLEIEYLIIEKPGEAGLCHEGMSSSKLHRYLLAEDLTRWLSLKAIMNGCCWSAFSRRSPSSAIGRRPLCLRHPRAERTRSGAQTLGSMP